MLQNVMKMDFYYYKIWSADLSTEKNQCANYQRFRGRPMGGATVGCEGRWSDVSASGRFVPYASARTFRLRTFRPEIAWITDVSAYVNPLWVLGDPRCKWCLEHWNMHGVTLDDRSRTNNICEGWNNKFACLVGTVHPSVWKLIECFQAECARVTAVLLQAEISVRQPKNRESLHWVA